MVCVCLYRFVFVCVCQCAYLCPCIANKRSHCLQRFAPRGINRHCLSCVPSLRLTFGTTSLILMTNQSVKLISEKGDDADDDDKDENGEDM